MEQRFSPCPCNLTRSSSLLYLILVVAFVHLSLCYIVLFLANPHEKMSNLDLSNRIKYDFNLQCNKKCQ